MVSVQLRGGETFLVYFLLLEGVVALYTPCILCKLPSLS